MIVTEHPVILVLPPPFEPRSVGVHASSIIRCAATEMGMLEKEWAEELSLVDARTITDPVALARISLGLAWEQYYLPLLPGVVDHPGEMQLQGVYLTPDGESVDIIRMPHGRWYARVVHECKLTWKSSNTVDNMKPNAKNWMWLAQIKGYCKAMNTRWAWMHVFFVNGDYSWPMRPTPRSWFIEFTQEEVDSNWSVLMQYKEDLEERLQNGTTKTGIIQTP